MALLEPSIVPGLDKALLELFAIFSAVVGSGLLITASSIVGLVRAGRRRRRHESSSPAVILALIANAITSLWLGYWVSVDIYNRSNPINALLAIDAAVCVFPLMWLVAAIRANRARHRRRLED